MLIIWGIRRKAKALGQIAYSCGSCGKATYHTAFVVRSWFTLFFIPLFPVGKKYGIACNLCGRRLNAVSNLEAQLRDWERTGQMKDSPALS